MLIDARHPGGLWKVRPEITTIFSVAEIWCCTINTKKMIEKLMVNSEILINYYSVYNDTPKEVEKEVALNLLERMLTLYIRVRAFSYAKKKVELCKIQRNISKSHSIRTKMKKSYMDRNKSKQLFLKPHIFKSINGLSTPFFIFLFFLIKYLYHSVQMCSILSPPPPPPPLYYQVCIWINVGNNFMVFIRLDPICSCKTEIP